MMTNINQTHYQIDKQEQEELIEVICQLKMKYTHQQVVRIVKRLYESVKNGGIQRYCSCGSITNREIGQDLYIGRKGSQIECQSREFYLKRMKGLWQKYNAIHFVNSWTKANEFQFLTMYLKEQKIGVVRNKLRAKYGLTKVFQNLRQLTFRFYKTIRFCLNRLQIFIQLYPTYYLPQLLPYKSDVINKIMISPTCLQIRLKLIRIHLMAEDDLQLMYDAVSDVNRLIMSMRSQWWKDGYEDWVQTDFDIST